MLRCFIWVICIFVPTFDSLPDILTMGGLSSLSSVLHASSFHMLSFLSVLLNVPVYCGNGTVTGSPYNMEATVQHSSSLRSLIKLFHANLRRWRYVITSFPWLLLWCSLSLTPLYSWFVFPSPWLCFVSSPSLIISSICIIIYLFVFSCHFPPCEAKRRWRPKTN